MAEHKMTIRVDEELHRRLKAKAALQGTTISAVVTELMEKWVKEAPVEYKVEAEE